MNKKDLKRAERVLKGAANRSRIRIMEFIATESDTSLWQISESLKIDFRLASHHAIILEKAGLLTKENIGRAVMHLPTPYCLALLKLIDSLKTF